MWTTLPHPEQFGLEQISSEEIVTIKTLYSVFCGVSRVMGTLSGKPSCCWIFKPNFSLLWALQTKFCSIEGGGSNLRDLHGETTTIGKFELWITVQFLFTKGVNKNNELIKNETHLSWISCDPLFAGGSQYHGLPPKIQMLSGYISND